MKDWRIFVIGLTLIALGFGVGGLTTPAAASAASVKAAAKALRTEILGISNLTARMEAIDTVIFWCQAYRSTVKREQADRAQFAGTVTDAVIEATYAEERAAIDDVFSEGENAEGE